LARGSELKGPILVELSRLFSGELGYLDSIDDARLYQNVVFATRVKYSTHDFSAQLAPEFDVVSEVLLRRLSSGWFREHRKIRSPQSWFSSHGSASNVSAKNAALGSFLEEKPFGALWTSSYLPNGESAWALLENIEFSGRERTHFSVNFAEDKANVYSIDAESDYRQLVLNYPRALRTGRVGVDWEAVAHDFHAVHLTARGLVTVQDVDIATPHGIARLQGWDSESTAWLVKPPGFTVESR